ncbi:MAG: hypothetical protein ACYC6Y_21470, partial [Thermoguttaceae bacterium]
MNISPGRRDDASILGLGTALPVHQMTQAEAVVMAKTICDLDDRNRRLLDVLYRRAGVRSRRTCVPHETAYRWTDAGGGGVVAEDPEAPSAGGGSLRGPTTRERMELYSQ